MSRSKIRVGDAFESDEEELTVVEIDSGADLVVAQDETGEEVALSLKVMLEDIRSGELRRVEPDDDEGQDDESEGAPTIHRRASRALARRIHR